MPYKYSQTKSSMSAIAYKRIQGGKQPDICLRVTSNFAWQSVSLELREHAPTSKKHASASKKRFHFRIEKEYGSKVWSKRCKKHLVHNSQSKNHTNIRVQFCREYYGLNLQFFVRTSKHTAMTKLPIFLLKSGTKQRLASRTHVVTFIPQHT